MNLLPTTAVDLDPAAKLPFKEKISYASGDFASCLYFGIFMNFLTYYYTDVFGIAAASVATMIFVTRTWDWINDPIMGWIADRTDTKLGKFRPWILRMILPYVLLGILTFTTFDLSDPGKLIYAYITYTLLTMAYTAINVPYSAMMGVMTARSDDRTELSSFRFIGAFAGTMVVSATMLGLVSFLGRGNDQMGFLLTVTIYAVFAGAAFFVTFRNCHERIRSPKTQSRTAKSEFDALLKNGPWLVMILVSVLTIIWIAIRSGVTIHYFKYAGGSEHWGSLFLVISNFVQLVGVAFTKYISHWLGGKKRAFIIINFVSAGLMGLFYFIPATNIPLVMTHQLISSMISAPLMPLFWSMIADTADYGALKTGQRSTALIFSAGTFSQKIGWSIGPALALVMLDRYGFVANVDQSAETIHGLRLIMSWYPAGVALLAGLAVFLYKITPDMEKEMERALREEHSIDRSAVGEV